MVGLEGGPGRAGGARRGRSARGRGKVPAHSKVLGDREWGIWEWATFCSFLGSVRGAELWLWPRSLDAALRPLSLKSPEGGHVMDDGACPPTRFLRKWALLVHPYSQRATAGRRPHKPRFLIACQIPNEDEVRSRHSALQGPQDPPNTRPSRSESGAVPPTLWAWWRAREHWGPVHPLTLGSHQHLRGLQGLPGPLRGHSPHSERVFLALLHVGVGEGGAVCRGLARPQPRAPASLLPLHYVMLHGPAPVVLWGPPAEADPSPLAILYLQGTLWGLGLVCGPTERSRKRRGGQRSWRGAVLDLPPHQRTSLRWGRVPREPWALPGSVPGLHPPTHTYTHRGDPKAPLWAVEAPAQPSGHRQS